MPENAGEVVSMARFNRGAARPAVSSPVLTEAVASGVTFEGGPGYARDAKGELFMLAVSLMGDDTFYESAGDRHARYTALVRQVATEDPAWITGFVGWLRDGANMRTASVVAATEATDAVDGGAAGWPPGRRRCPQAGRRARRDPRVLADPLWPEAADRPQPGRR
jgi:hypothetical protein